MTAILQRRLMGDGEGANRIHWRTSDVDRVVRHLGLDINIATVPMLEREATAALPHATPSKQPTREGGNRYTFTISTATVDRMGDTIAVAGWHLARYRQNPVVLWGHQQRLLPIGRAVATWIDGNRLRSTVELAASNPQARQVQVLIEEGVLRATSVGFNPIKLQFSQAADRQYGIDFLEQELVEWSIVTVPANPDALLEGKGSGDQIDTAQSRARRQRELEIIRLRA